MKTFKFSGRGRPVPREAFFSGVQHGLAAHGVDRQFLVNLAHSGKFNLVKNESRLIATLNLLRRGFSREDVGNILRPDVDTNLYSEAFKHGLHPREVNKAIEDHDLIPTVEEFGRNETTRNLEHVERHGGLYDLITCIKSGATLPEVYDALDRIKSTDRELRPLHQGVLDQLGDPTLPKIFPLQSSLRVITRPTVGKISKLKTTVPDEYNEFDTVGVPSQRGLTDTSSWQELKNAIFDSGLSGEEILKNPTSLNSSEQVGVDPGSLEEPSFLRDSDPSEIESAQTVKQFHPLKLYADFRKAPGTTHSDFVEALELCKKKWGNLHTRDKYSSQTSIPRLLNTFSNLRFSGGSQHEVKQVMEQASPELFQDPKITNFLPLVPFHEFKHAWDLVQDRQQSGSIDGPMQSKLIGDYLHHRVINNLDHNQALGKSLFGDSTTPTPKRVYRSPRPSALPTIDINDLLRDQL